MDVYKGETSWLAVVDVDAPIAAAAIKWPREYVQAYASAAKAANEYGKAKEEAVYRFLQVITGIYPSFHKPEQPYSPWISGPGGRSEMPSDFTHKDIEAIEQLAERTTNKALRAHLLDMMVAGPTKDYRAAAKAAPLFLELAKELVGKNDAHGLKDALHRGIQLARRTGWNKEIGETARTTALELTRELGKEPYTYDLQVCLRLLREERLGEMAEWRTMATRAADYHKKLDDEYSVQGYSKEVVCFSQLLQDVDGEHGASREIGESLVRQANKRATQSGSPFMAAASILKQGIEALRRGRAPKERITELLDLLRDYQSKIGGELGHFSSSVDVTAVVQAVRKHIEGQPFGIALLRFAFGHELTDVARLRQRILDSAKEHPFLDLFNTLLLDSAGRTKEVRGGLIEAKSDERDDAVHGRMIAHACQFDWGYRAQVIIEPGRGIIYSEHHPSRESLMPLVVGNPFIPTGHEELFLRGLLAGFDGDLILASHLLVPQFENSVRHLLESQGVHVANLNTDSTEPLKLWGGILDLPETKEILGGSMIFEIKGILVEPSGYNFRNELAHGMLRSTSFFSAAGLNVWWLMLRLCLTPVVDRFDGSTSRESA